MKIGKDSERSIASNPEITDSELDSALEQTIFRSLPSVSKWLTLLYLILAVAHALSLPKEMAFIMTVTVTASTTALILFALLLVLRYDLFPVGWTYKIAFGIVTLVLINSWLHFYLSADFQQTTNFMLLIIAASFFFLSMGWFCFILLTIVAGWAVIVVLIEPSPFLIHYSFALFQSTVVALLINTLRTDNLRRLERSHLQNKYQNAQLILKIYQHQQTEHTLRESEEKYRSTMNAALISIYVIRDFVFDYVNPVMADLFGYTTREMEGRLNPIDLVIPEQRQVVRDRLVQRAQGIPSAPVELRCVRKDGSLFDAMVWAREITYQAQRIVVGTLVDITDHKQAEQALRGLNAVLEARVKERTEELERANAALLREIADRKAYEAKLEHQAKYDSLTDLPNRSLLRDRLSHALLQAYRSKTRVAVLFLDLDRFKLINDSLGHAAGDSLLKDVAMRLQASVRESDTVARLGGDEFVIVLEDLSSEHGAMLVANKILRKMERSFTLDAQEFFVSCTIGISLFPANGEDPDTLLKNANTAMHRGKDRGRNSVRFYTSEMNARASEHLKLQNSLHQALDAEQLIPYY